MTLLPIAAWIALIGGLIAAIVLGVLGLALGWALGGLEKLESLRADLAGWLLLAPPPTPAQPANNVRVAQQPRPVTGNPTLNAADAGASDLDPADYTGGVDTDVYDNTATIEETTKSGRDILAVRFDLTREFDAAVAAADPFGGYLYERR